MGKRFFFCNSQAGFIHFGTFPVEIYKNFFATKKFFIQFNFAIFHNNLRKIIANLRTLWYI